jgi:integrase
MSLSGLSASTVRAATTLLGGILEAATLDRVIPFNPARGVKLPRLDYREQRYLQPDEIEHLASTIAQRFRAMVILAAYTGLRWGECAGLAVPAVNLLGRSLVVTTTANEVRGKVVFGPPKTKRSVRRIALPLFVCEELSVHIAQFGLSENGLIFSDSVGHALRRSNWRQRVWQPAVVASVGEPMRFHDLRHSHAALLIKQGEHPRLIQERLGHASSRTTLDLYGHVFDGLDESAADRLDETYRTSIRTA